MTTPPTNLNRRILIIDDSPSIHSDFRKVLGGQDTSPEEQAPETEALLGETVEKSRRAGFALTAAMRGEEGLSAVREAVQAGNPFAMAFVDVRMPQGWNGIETAARIWEVDPEIQIVLCSAYSDFSWDEITKRLGSTDRLVILRKPFDPIEVLQLAYALTEKWSLLQRSKGEFQNLERMVSNRTKDLLKSNAQLQLEIREHQHTVETLRATQEKLGHFLARSPVVIYSFKIDGEELVPEWITANYSIFVGGAIEEWFKLAPALAYVEETDRETVMAGLNALLEQDALGMKYRIRRKDGQIRWVRDDQKLLRDASGRPVEIIGCWTDITDQQLLQEQLRQAQKMESVGQLAGGVAHDFNNLLMVIQGYIEILLKNEHLKDSVVKLLNQMHSATEKAEHLTEQLLAFSRKQMMHPEELDLNDLLATVSSLLERTLGEHIAIQIHGEQTCPASWPIEAGLTR